MRSSFDEYLASISSADIFSRSIRVGIVHIFFSDSARDITIVLEDPLLADLRYFSERFVLRVLGFCQYQLLVITEIVSVLIFERYWVLSQRPL
jgi:hypothetical protein